jgi:Zn-dependent protease
MLGKSIRVGKILGINVTVSWSFLALVGALSLYLAFESANFLVGLVAGLVSLTLVFASVLVHELGHSVVAQRLGVRIAEIELHFFGGAAKMLNMPRRPRDEVLIAGAGPLTSLVLAGIFLLASLVIPDGLGLLRGIATANLMLGVFNLIPALPTDGGRILRAAMTPRFGPLEATRLAVGVSRIATIGLVVWALIPPMNLFAVGVAAFLWMLATRELRIAQALYGAGRLGFGPTPRSDVASGEGYVEVFDRDGRFVGSAPGGVARPGPEGPASDPWTPRAPRRVGWQWGGPASFFGPDLGARPRPPAGSAVRLVTVRDANGRLWVVAQNGPFI